MPEYKGYCDECGFDCCCDIIAEEKANGWGDYAPEDSDRTERTGWSTCQSCGSAEVYEGQCPCWVGEHADDELVEAVDKGVLEQLRLELASGRLVFGYEPTYEQIYAAFETAPPGSVLDEALRDKLAWFTGKGVGSFKRGLPAEQRPKAIQPADRFDEAKMKERYDLYIQWAPELAMLVQIARAMGICYDADVDAVVAAEITRRGKKLWQYDPEELYQLGQAEERMFGRLRSMDSSKLERIEAAFGPGGTLPVVAEARAAVAAGTATPEQVELAGKAVESTSTGEGDAAAVVGDDAGPSHTGPGSAAAADATGGIFVIPEPFVAAVKGDLPTEPYDNGYCWFYAIDPDSLAKMWDEVECSRYASLREINQLGITYGFSRRRLVISRVADGKYHMEPDVGGQSGDARNFQAWLKEIYTPNGMHSRAKTGVFGMPYSNFEGKMRVASTGSWVEVQQLLEVVNACLGRDFSKVTERRAAADDFKKMERRAPFEHFVRFPSHVQYVWMDGGDWPNKEMQLFAALSFQDSSVEDNRAAPGRGDGNGQRNQPVTNSFGYNDAATAYYNALRNMKNQVVGLSGVYDREVLERSFRSYWTADKVIDLKEEVRGVVQPNHLYINEHAPASWAWGGLNRYIELSDVNDQTTIPSSGIIVMWTVNRTANHRARFVLQRDQHGGLNAISCEVVATND